VTTDHTPVTDHLSSYVDGELAPAERNAFEAHLKACGECQKNLDQFRGTLGKLSQLKRKAPRSFLPQIQQQIHERSRGRFFGRRWMLFGRIPFEWVSLVMIIAMLVYYIATLQSAPTTVTPGP
jgi:anti-sigma factor RsiW